MQFCTIVKLSYGNNMVWIYWHVKELRTLHMYLISFSELAMHYILKLCSCVNWQRVFALNRAIHWIPCHLFLSRLARTHTSVYEIAMHWILRPVFLYKPTMFSYTERAMNWSPRPGSNSLIWRGITAGDGDHDRSRRRARSWVWRREIDHGRGRSKTRESSVARFSVGCMGAPPASQSMSLTKTNDARPAARDCTRSAFDDSPSWDWRRRSNGFRGVSAKQRFSIWFLSHVWSMPSALEWMVYKVFRFALIESLHWILRL